MSHPGMFSIYIVDIFRAMTPTIAVSVIKSIFPFLFFFLVYPSYVSTWPSLPSKFACSLCRCNNSCPGYIHGPLYLMPSLNFCQVASGNVDSLLHRRLQDSRRFIFFFHLTLLRPTYCWPIASRSIMRGGCATGVASRVGTKHPRLSH